MTKKAVIFDFDGTLADVEVLFLEIYNQLAREFGYSTVTEEDIPNLKTLGAKELIRTKLHLPFYKLPGLIKRGLAEYRREMGTVELFPGVVTLIQELQAKAIRVGIVSSNDSDIIRAILARYALEVDFIYRSSLFGKASVLKKMLKKEKLLLNEVVYVGDEIRDVEACQKIGMDIVSVTWGLNTKEVLEGMNPQVMDTSEALHTKLMNL